MQALRLTRLLDLVLCTKSSAQHASAFQQPCAGWCARPHIDLHISQIHTGLHMQDSTYKPRGTPAVAPADVGESNNKSGAAATATPNVALERQAHPPPNVDPVSMSAQQPDINDTEVSQVGNSLICALGLVLFILQAHLTVPQGLLSAIHWVADGAMQWHAIQQVALDRALACTAPCGCTLLRNSLISALQKLC